MLRITSFIYLVFVCWDWYFVDQPEDNVKSLSRIGRCRRQRHLSGYCQRHLQVGMVAKELVNVMKP